MVLGASFMVAYKDREAKLIDPKEPSLSAGQYQSSEKRWQNEEQRPCIRLFSYLNRKEEKHKMESVKMTDEIRQKLLGIAPFSTDSTVSYTPPRYQIAELPKEFTPIFQVKSLTRSEKDQAQKMVSDMSKVSDAEVREFVRKKIAGWENLYDAGTKEKIEFFADGDGVASKEVFDRIPDNACGELIFYVIKISGLFKSDKLSLMS